MSRSWGGTQVNLLPERLTVRRLFILIISLGRSLSAMWLFLRIKWVREVRLVIESQTSWMELLEKLSLVRFEKHVMVSGIVERRLPTAARWSIYIKNFIRNHSDQSQTFLWASWSSSVIIFIRFSSSMPVSSCMLDRLSRHSLKSLVRKR